jgi:hypothetical protein
LLFLLGFLNLQVFSMATKLHAVIQRMAEVNDNIHSYSEDCSSVNNVSKLWRQSYLISEEIRNKDGAKKEMEDSSLLIFKRDQK